MSFFSLMPGENQQIEASSQFWISCIYVHFFFCYSGITSRKATRLLVNTTLIFYFLHDDLQFHLMLIFKHWNASNI